MAALLATEWECARARPPFDRGYSTVKMSLMGALLLIMQDPVPPPHRITFGATDAPATLLAGSRPRGRYRGHDHLNKPLERELIAV